MDPTQVNNAHLQFHRYQTGPITESMPTLSSAPPSNASYIEKPLVSRDMSDGILSKEAPLYDKKGLPLVPQPSNFKDDPLNWPAWLKWAVLLQVSFMAFLGPYNAALINPSLVLLSEYLNVDPHKAAYTTTTSIIAGGVAPFFWIPLSDVYGRRPIVLLCLLTTIVGGIASATATSFGSLAGARGVAGMGFGGLMTVGTLVVNDLFFLHERGQKTGIYTLFVTNGAHVAFIIGGYIGQALSWRWDYWTGVLTTLASLLVALPLFPETLFHRSPLLLSHRRITRTWPQMLYCLSLNALQSPPLQLSAFILPLKILRQPTITLPLIHYTIAWTLGNILPAITIAQLFTQFYHISASQIGVSFGVSTIIGSLLGETLAGALTDRLLSHFALKSALTRPLPAISKSDLTTPTSHTSKSLLLPHPSLRLLPTLLSSLLLPTGILIFGLTLPISSTPYPPLLGLGIAVFALQISSTTCYAYISDVHPEFTSEAGTLFNLGRGLSFVIGYFALPLADRIGYRGAWGVFAAIAWVGWWGVGFLLVQGWRGRRRRQ